MEIIAALTPISDEVVDLVDKFQGSLGVSRLFTQVGIGKVDAEEKRTIYIKVDFDVVKEGWVWRPAQFLLLVQKLAKHFLPNVIGGVHIAWVFLLVDAEWTEELDDLRSLQMVIEEALGQDDPKAYERLKKYKRDRIWDRRKHFTDVDASKFKKYASAYEKKVLGQALSRVGNAVAKGVGFGVSAIVAYNITRHLVGKLLGVK